MTALHRGSLRTYAGPEELSRDVAAELCNLLTTDPAARPTIALAGGSTPRRVYELLATEPLPWSRLQLFWGDERAVPPDHQDSNYRMVSEALLQHVKLPEEHVHRIPAEQPDADVAYEGELGRVFGIRPGGHAPAFDLVLLGLGTDGHTASLFPGTAALREAKRWVVSTQVPQTGDTRYTLTPPVLRAARRVLVLVSGAAKAIALRQVLEGPLDIQRWPAQIIADQAEWFVDAAAAAQLSSSPSPPSEA